MLNRDQLKHEAKQIVGNARVSAYIITLLFIGITSTLDVVQAFVNGDFARLWEAYMELYQEILPETIPAPDFLYGLAGQAQPIVLFITVITLLIGTVLQSGLVMYHLGIRRGERMPYTTLFDGFSFVGKIILLQLLTFLIVFLWTWVLVVPGFIAAYRYRFALYNLCENPEMGVLEAMRMSKAQTYGYKMELFSLDISFIGWKLLCSLTGGILSIWISPYIMQTDIGYFRQIKTIKKIGWFPPEDPLDDGQFHSQDPFRTEQ